MNFLMFQIYFLLCVFSMYFCTISIHCLKSNHPHFVWQETSDGGRELKPRLPLTNITHFLSFLQTDTTLDAKDKGSFDHGLCTCRIDMQSNNFLNQLRDTTKRTPNEPSFRQFQPLPLDRYFTNNNSLYYDHPYHNRQETIRHALNERQMTMQNTVPLLNMPQQTPKNFLPRPYFSSYVQTRRNYRKPHVFINENSANA